MTALESPDDEPFRHGVGERLGLHSECDPALSWQDLGPVLDSIGRHLRDTGWTWCRHDGLPMTPDDWRAGVRPVFTRAAVVDSAVSDADSLTCTERTITSDQINELGRRLAPCSHLRWLAKWMKAVALFGAQHPATLGCLLALVREAWGEPRISVYWHEDMGEWCCENPTSNGWRRWARSEAEALVMAMLAAPPHTAN